MKRTLSVTLPAVGLVGLTVLGLVWFWPRPPLDAALTAPGAPPARVVCSGYVDTRQGTLLLLPARAGRVAQVYVKAGQTVSKDTPLLQLDDRLARLQEQEAALAVRAAGEQLRKAEAGRAQYWARRDQAETAVEAAHIQLRRAAHTLEVAEQMHKDGVFNDGYMDLKRDQVDGARALIKLERQKLAELKAADPELDVKLALLQKERGEVRLAQARREGEEHVLKAPVGGTVLRVSAQEGDLVGPTSPRPAVWLAPAGDPVVRAEVSQEFAPRVREGLAVQVEDEAGAGVLARGVITEVSDWFLPRRQFDAAPTGVTTGLTLECVIELREAYAPLRLGQRVRVRVLADQPAGGSAPGAKR